MPIDVEGGGLRSDYRELYRDFCSQIEQRAAEAMADPAMDVKCRAGCHWCCYYPITATTLEAQVIVEWLDRAEGQVREQMVGRLLEYPGRYAAATEGLDQSSESWWVQFGSQRLPCPFLVDGMCGIYEVRPLVCRGWYSVSDPETVCASTDPATRVMALLAPFEVVPLAHSMMKITEKATGGLARKGPLPHTVLLVLSERAPRNS